MGKVWVVGKGKLRGDYFSYNIGGYFFYVVFKWI